VQTRVSRPATARGRRCFLALLLILGLAGCTRGGRGLPDVEVEVAVEPQPPQIGPAVVLVTLTGATGQALADAQVELEGNMTHAGMVPVLAPAVEVEPGRYRAELEFTMGGDWYILVRAKLADGRSLEEKVDVPGVGDVCIVTPAP
jgi:hypothetical protein